MWCNHYLGMNFGCVRNMNRLAIEGKRAEDEMLDEGTQKPETKLNVKTLNFQLITWRERFVI